MQFHKLEKPKDPNFWSVRVSKDVRLIVHRTAQSLLLCYVDHHDAAYKWAERRRLETHPKTGAAQFVEIRERVQEIVHPHYVEAAVPAPAKPALFAGMDDEELLQYGVPQEWLHDVKAADEDTLFEVADHLPKEAAEALLELATGATPQVFGPPAPALPVEGPVFSFLTAKAVSLKAGAAANRAALEHPDAQRRFRVIKNAEELELALSYPWEKWTVFLHPAQQQIIVRAYNGPARVSGSAGTGKTIVALHRAVHLARRNPETRVLLTTFSAPLANALRLKLRQLISTQPQLGERMEVHAINSIATRLYELNVGKALIASPEMLRQVIEDVRKAVPESKFSTQFLLTEWAQVVDAWQLEHWEAYRDVARLGRRTRLKEPQRAILWSIFEQVRAALQTKGAITLSGMFNRLASFFAGHASSPFDFVVVDESQDISIAQLRFLAALKTGRSDGLFFAGDLGQRIFQ